ncbi:MAG TPA: deoxyribonuclease IV [Firmicutes bacterium]|jgi:deoxyribonuclease-4|nr:deoxyribonuclease IV [Bacillota bacterium]
MRIGVHVSIGKGLRQAVQTAKHLGCDAFQIFIGNPRGWKKKPLADQEVVEFRQAVQETGLGPVVVHLSYLPNPAAEDEALYEKSILGMAEEYQRAVMIGADYFVVHPGKRGRQDQEKALLKVARGVREILKQVEGPTLFLLENQAGAGTEVGGNLSQLVRILKEIDHPERTGICFDTCHAFAAGYELRTKEGIDCLLKEVESTVGLKRMPLLHLNDALGALGSHLDRHTHIGQGQIGTEGFRLLLTDPRLSGLTGILETPQQTPDDDLKNMALLRQLACGEAR